mmetsp:Transcript_50696/g.121079  ORF Transcript_50696/g.121079 Transcript_50696/m.121079 type:complete len:258 (+) Transcript_50696:396-1169(+)
MKRGGLHTDVRDQTAAINIGDILFLEHCSESRVIGLHVIKEGGVGVDVGLHTLVNREVCVLDDQIFVTLPTFGVLHCVPRVKDLLVLWPVFVFLESYESEGVELFHLLLDCHFALARGFHKGAVVVGMPVVRDNHDIELVTKVVDDRDNVCCAVRIRKRSGDEIVLHIDDDQGSLGADLLLTGLIQPQESTQLVHTDGAILVHVQGVVHCCHIRIREIFTWEGILHQGLQLRHIQQAIAVVVVLLEDLLRQVVRLVR